MTGDALRLFEHFLDYGKRNFVEVADAMYYDYDAFLRRLAMIQTAYDKAGKAK